ncbi:MAG: hypothetical protein SXQ77_00905, partial [Halobacteria archaeon]|nr:hypothetical protein [Halobacteria archaeon]
MWYSHFALLGLAGISFLKAGASLAASVVAVPLLVGANVKLAETLWYSDPKEKELEKDEKEVRGTSMLDTVLEVSASSLSLPTKAVVRKSWVRARRSPLKLVFVVYPVFFAYQPVYSAYQAGRVTSVIPLLVGFYGAWATGAAFSLNPLGDEGSVLP